MFSGDDIDRDEDLQKLQLQRQIQSDSKTQCMLYFSKTGGSRIQNGRLLVMTKTKTQFNALLGVNI